MTALLYAGALISGVAAWLALAVTAVAAIVTSGLVMDEQPYRRWAFILAGAGAAVVLFSGLTYVLVTAASNG